MIQTKAAYVTPTTDTLELRNEGVICQSVPNSSINPLEYDDDPLHF